MDDLDKLIQTIAAPPLPSALYLSGDYAVCGDVHNPFADWQWMRRVAIVARKELRRPRKLIVAGDFFNLDAFSQYLQVTHAPTWAEEREACKAAILYWLETFAEITMLMGNHERRMQRFTAGEFGESDLLALIYSNPNRVTMSPRGWCEVESGGERWRITHPKNYSINRLTVANDIAMKYRCHVLSAHEHHLAMSMDRYGRYCIVNMGCLVDPSKLAYVALDDNKSAAMVNGFVILKGGVPHLFGPHPLTDWSKYE